MHADSPTVPAGLPAAATAAAVERLAEFHALAGHDGPASIGRQHASNARFRRHQRDLGRQMDAILGKAVTG